MKNKIRILVKKGQKPFIGESYWLAPADIKTKSQISKFLLDMNMENFTSFAGEYKVKQIDSAKFIPSELNPSYYGFYSG